MAKKKVELAAQEALETGAPSIIDGIVSVLNRAGGKRFVKEVIMLAEEHKSYKKDAQELEKLLQKADEKCSSAFELVNETNQQRRKALSEIRYVRSLVHAKVCLLKAMNNAYISLAVLGWMPILSFTAFAFSTSPSLVFTIWNDVLQVVSLVFLVIGIVGFFGILEAAFAIPAAKKEFTDLCEQEPDIENV